MGKYKHSKITPQMEDEDSYSWLSRIVTTLPDMIYNQAKKGHPRFSGLLWELAAFSTERLQKLANENPELLKINAVHQHNWPGFIGPHPDENKKNLKLIESLGVGKKAELNLYPSGKPWSNYTLANRFMRDYYYLISNIKMTPLTDEISDELGILKNSAILHKERREKIKNLPELNKKTAPIWFEIMWEHMMEEYDGHPEKSPPDNPELPALRELGEHRGSHSKHLGQQEKVTPDTREANIKDGIKKRLKQALITMAKPA